ncbi:MAG: CDP-glycerol:glycerophosphate glycerophosphotransferase [Acutalibacteraceae bacterium]
MKNYKYKFSVVIPIYNVEDYLEETVESVIHQSIGFKKNIQIILVNDGSPDNSDAICKKYQKLYPDNVVYIKKENAGVSAARNSGIPYVEGKYVNFLDSDDKWELSAFKKIYKFFEEHYDEIDVVSCRMKHFEATNRFHAVDYKFAPGTRVADVMTPEESNSIQLHITSSFVKSEAIKDDTRFVEGMKFGEDGLFINEIILRKAKFGIMADALHYYRKRANQSSAVQTQKLNKEYYSASPRKYYYSLIEISKKKYGSVIPYVQNILAYDMGWRLQSEIPKGVLTDSEYAEYIGMLHDLFSYIDDTVILKSKVHVSIMRKLTAFSIKNDSDSFFKDMVYNHEEQSLYYKDIKMVSLNLNNNACFVNIAKIENNIFHIEGLIAKWVLEATKHKTRFVLSFGGKEYEPELTEFPFKTEHTFFGIKKSCYRFCADFPLDDLNNSSESLFFKPIIYFDDLVCNVGINYGKFVANYNSFVFSYKNFDPYYIKCYRTSIRIAKPKYFHLTTAVNEAKCLLWLLLRKHRRAFLIRVLYILLHGFIKKGKKIWLISDRSDKANDNGEAFFKYVCKKAPNSIKPIFVIDKNSEDEPRMHKFGKVIHFQDKLYPFYFLAADKIISSSGGEYVINPFGNINRRYLTDLMKFDYVFLQHGITMNNLSKWLQKFSKNISLFVTATKKEYESISGTEYLYTPKEVKLTGFARFDELENKAEKLIVILPTWRRSIKESYDAETKSVYFDGFKDTGYFKFYNALINDERLLGAMKSAGYKGLFCLHPIHMKQYIDFKENDVFKINSGFVNYKEVFSKGALLVTDYSSVAFDFAYLRKPVIYAQFDKEEFFEGQIYEEGYFSYDNDGPGPVCGDLESTVDSIISLINNDCRLAPEYSERVESLFAFNDRNNCERIYNEILKIDKE